MQSFEENGILAHLKECFSLKIIVWVFSLWFLLIFNDIFDTNLCQGMALFHAVT